MSRGLPLTSALAALALSACGAAGTTAHAPASPSSPTSPTSPTSSISTPSASPTASASGGATPPASIPPGPWLGQNAADAYFASYYDFNNAKNTVVQGINTFADPPSDADFASVWAPIAQSCTRAAALARSTVAKIDSDLAAHNYPAVGVKAIRRSVQEIRWFGRVISFCPTITSKGQLLGWLLDADTDRWNKIHTYTDAAYDVLKRS